MHTCLHVLRLQSSWFIYEITHLESNGSVTFPLYFNDIRSFQIQIFFLIMPYLCCAKTCRTHSLCECKHLTVKSINFFSENIIFILLVFIVFIGYLMCDLHILNFDLSSNLLLSLKIQINAHVEGRNSKDSTLYHNKSDVGIVRKSCLKAHLSNDNM